VALFLHCPAPKYSKHKAKVHFMAANGQDEININAPHDGATFAVDEKRRSGDDIPDPEAAVRHETTAGAADAGTSGAAVTQTEDELGAVDTGERGQGSGFGAVDLSTTGAVALDRGPAGAGPVEGSASGATAPKLEMTDVGLVDVSVVDVSTLAEPTDAPDAPGNARAEAAVEAVRGEDIDADSASTESDAGVMQDGGITQGIGDAA
jgi:hypothetical protein